MKKIFNASIIIALDFLTFLFLAFVLKRWYSYIEDIIESIPHPYVLFSKSLEDIQDIFTPDPRLRILTSMILAASMILIIIITSRAAIWMIASRKKEFARFLLITFCWYLILIPAAALSIIMKQGASQIFLMIFIPIFIHYTISFNLQLTKDIKFRQIQKALIIGTKRIHIFLLFYISFLIILSISLKLLWAHWYIIAFLVAVMFQSIRHLMLNKPLNI